MKKVILILIFISSLTVPSCSKDDSKDDSNNCNCENIRGYRINMCDDWSVTKETLENDASDKELSLFQERSPCN